MQKTIQILICSILFSFLHVESRVVDVNTSSELLNAAKNALIKDTIIVNDGTYLISGVFAIAVNTDSITFKGKSGNREKVIITGNGMKGNVNHGFWVSAHGATIQNMTIQNVANHCIQADVNTDCMHVINCILRDGGEQLLKIPKSTTVNDPSENGLIENCLFEYSAGIGPQYYIGGVDCHFGKNWIIRNNVFKYIRSPENSIAEHAIHFWSNSENTIVEKNIIIDCDRGIGFGLGESKHIGGIIRNNMIYHRNISGHDNGDVGIVLESATNTQVYNNSIFFDNNYPNAIEYRFTSTSGVNISNNLTNKLIRLRDGASGIVTNNITNAKSAWFKDVSSGDLHLSSESISEVIGKGIVIPGLNDDFDDDKRASNNIEIGADEYSPSSINISKNNKKLNKHVGQLQKISLLQSGQILVYYKINTSGNVQIEIYDFSGKLIESMNKKNCTGIHAETFNKIDFTTGKHIIILSINNKKTDIDYINSTK